MKKNILKNSALVFLAGASYGVQGTVVKLTLAAGFTWQQSVASQAVFGVVLFLAALLVQIVRGKKIVSLSPKLILMLLGVGFVSGTTGVLYNISLSMLPVPIAVTLLFQFTWIGIVIQVIATRRAPSVFEVGAGVVIIAGTLLVSGLFSADITALNPLGVVCGLGSGVSFATFVFLSGKVGAGLPSIQRGSIICLGSLCMAFFVCPDFLISGAIQEGIWLYGLMMGAGALFIPVILLGIATPHLSTGLATIMAASELPCGVIISVVVLGETVDVFQFVGVVIILTGVVVAQLPNLLPGLQAPPRPPVRYIQ